MRFHAAADTGRRTVTASPALRSPAHSKTSAGGVPSLTGAANLDGWGIVGVGGDEYTRLEYTGEHRLTIGCYLADAMRAANVRTNK